jgi:H+/gluconate symporter-like permease
MQGVSDALQLDTVVVAPIMAIPLLIILLFWFRTGKKTEKKEKKKAKKKQKTKTEDTTLKSEEGSL